LLGGGISIAGIYISSKAGQKRKKTEEKIIEKEKEKEVIVIR
jgi:hypothetical protein